MPRVSYRKEWLAKSGEEKYTYWFSVMAGTIDAIRREMGPLLDERFSN